jgi:hypothetical protein
MVSHKKKEEVHMMKWEVGIHIGFVLEDLEALV